MTNISYNIDNLKKTCHFNEGKLYVYSPSATDVLHTKQTEGGHLVKGCFFKEKGEEISLSATKEERWKSYAVLPVRFISVGSFCLCLKISEEFAPVVGAPTIYFLCGDKVLQTSVWNWRRDFALYPQ